MNIFSFILVLLIALLHFGFLILEMFYWTKPLGLKIFRNSLLQAQSSKVLAMNQGLYNGFLSAGLLWGLFQPSREIGLQIQIFFLSCVLCAGFFGAITVSRKIFFIQGFPAILAILILVMT